MSGKRRALREDKDALQSRSLTEELQIKLWRVFSSHTPLSLRNSSDAPKLGVFLGSLYTQRRGGTCRGDSDKL